MPSAVVLYRLANLLELGGLLCRSAVHCQVYWTICNMQHTQERPGAVQSTPPAQTVGPVLPAAQEAMVQLAGQEVCFAQNQFVLMCCVVQ
jgi:hypothetical protein